MNQARRKKISTIVAALEELKSQIEDLQCEEQEAFDNMPEGLQAGEKGQASEGAANSLQEAIDGGFYAVDGFLGEAEAA